jgi:hypothetical protein
MKIIMSRKGFDSAYGGYPSPILPDGKMVSLSIPSGDSLRYSDLKVKEGLTYYVECTWTAPIQVDNELSDKAQWRGCT